MIKAFLISIILSICSSALAEDHGPPCPPGFSQVERPYYGCICEGKVDNKGNCIPKPKKETPDGGVDHSKPHLHCENGKCTVVTTSP